MTVVRHASYFDGHWAMRTVFGDGHHVVARTFAWLLLWFGLILAVCSIEGSLRLPERHVGLLNDVYMFCLLATAIALVVMAVRLLRTVESVLDQLPRLLKNPGESKVRFLADLRRIREFVAIRTSTSRRWYYALLSGMVGMVVFFQVVIPFWLPPPVRAWSIWPSEYPASFAIAIPWAVYWTVFILGNVVWISASSTFNIVRVVNRYANRDELSTVPLAPDGCGGTSCIGELALANTMLAGCGMILVVAWLIAFGINAALVVGFIIYSMFLCALFVVPCLSIHRVMRQAKLRDLERLSRIAEQHRAAVPWQEEVQFSAADENWWRTVSSDVQFRSNLERLHVRAREMPEWPFDAMTVGRFFSLVVVPGALFVIQLVSQEALTKLAQEFTAELPW